jgi:hypothetical protein
VETLNLPRANLPQVRDKVAFRDWLHKHNIAWRFISDAKAVDFKPTQFDFDYTKVVGMSEEPEKHRQNPIIVADDNHICDGHHRWAAILRADAQGTLAVLKVHVPIQHLLGLAHQFLADTQSLNITEMVEQDPDLLFESIFNEAVKDPKVPGDVEMGDPGYVLRRLKKVAIHTQNTKPATGTLNTTIRTQYDKISPPQGGTRADESGEVPGELDPVKIEENDDKYVMGEDRQTKVPDRVNQEIEHIKKNFKDGKMSWPAAHRELLHRGMSVGDIPKHIGEDKSMNPLNKFRSALKEARGKTKVGGKADTVIQEPNLDRFSPAWN